MDTKKAILVIAGLLCIVASILMLVQKNRMNSDYNNLVNTLNIQDVNKLQKLTSIVSNGENSLVYSGIFLVIVGAGLIALPFVNL